MAWLSGNFAPFAVTFRAVWSLGRGKSPERALEEPEGVFCASSGAIAGRQTGRGRTGVCLEVFSNLDAVESDGRITRVAGVDGGIISDTSDEGNLAIKSKVGTVSSIETGHDGKAYFNSASTPICSSPCRAST